ncbi:hypothetical protein F5Y10DRAFT_62849 [Nemania abortiva]|nr:hypothetical protein F5Y10DRAFT_62849 [Nemania abortiva]
MVGWEQRGVGLVVSLLCQRRAGWLGLTGSAGMGRGRSWRCLGTAPYRCWGKGSKSGSGRCCVRAASGQKGQAMASAQGKACRRAANEGPQARVHKLAPSCFQTVPVSDCFSLKEHTLIRPNSIR